MKELEKLLRSEGWSPLTRTRYHQQYVYAMQRQGKRVQEVYIAPVLKLDQLTQEKVLAKLQAKIKTA